MADQGESGLPSAALARLRSIKALRSRRGSELHPAAYRSATAHELAQPPTGAEPAPAEELQVEVSARSAGAGNATGMGMPSLANFASFRGTQVRSPELLVRPGAPPGGGGGSPAASSDKGKGEERVSLSELGETLRRSLNGGVPKLKHGENRLSVSSLSSEVAAAAAAPAAEPDEPAEEPDEEAEVPAAIEILFVDDCRIQRKLVPRLLEPLGIIVNTVASGEEAMEWLDKRFSKSGPASFPVVILQDLHMPTPMSGRDTAIAFRRKFPDLPTPIIAYTADDDESIIPGLLEDGFTDYVAKMPGCRGLKARLQVRVLYAPSPRLVKSFSNMKLARDDENVSGGTTTTAAAAAAAVAAADAAAAASAAAASTDTSTTAPPSPAKDATSKAAGVPRAQNSFPAAEEPAPEALPEVLLVDDDMIQRTVVPKVLSKIGVKVTAIESGDSAVMMLRARHKRKGPESFPDIIILDLHMPGMSGVETARAIREKFPEVRIPIIAFTGDEDESIVPALMDAGFSDYVAKLPQCRGLRARIQVQLSLIENQKRSAAFLGNDERLKDVLPANVLNNIRHGSQAFESVTILFVLIHRFTEVLDQIGDSDFADLNAAAYEKLCSIADKRSLHCKEEEGGIFMVVGGCNEATKKDHTNRIIETAGEMLSSTVRTPKGRKVRFQVGIHTGSAHAGIVGVQNERFCFFGDTVSIARHIAGHGYPDCLNISAVTHRVHMCLPRGLQTALSETTHSVIIIRNWT